MTFSCEATRKNSLSAIQAEKIIKKALLSRRTEEKLLDLFSEGKLFGTVHTCIGQEFVGAIVTELLNEKDSIFSNHRCHGHFLSFTDDVEGLIAEIMGKETGVCGGRGGSQHLCKNGFFSNGIQGGIVPVATGIAFAKKISGTKNVSVVFIGDGTLGEGALYESLNIASKWELPLLIVLENNGYAQSTSQHETLAGSITGRAEAFGIKAFKGDTWNWESFFSTCSEAVEWIRSTHQPAFIQVDTFRLKAHSKGDDNRPRTAVEPFEKTDPLSKLLNTGKLTVVDEVIRARLQKSVEAAEKSAYPTPSQEPSPSTNIEWMQHKPTKRKMVKAINETFKELMRKYPSLYFFGEDVMSPYGGAFKVSQGLSDEFPGRVLNTPISEGAIVGIGTGLALSGLKPFVEIMFGDFSTLAFDQLLNHAAKFEYMYNQQVTVDVVVRTPMGGKRGYGPTHSQSIEKHFLGVPGLTVVALNHLIEPLLVYEKFLSEHCGPTLLVENKILYTLNLKEDLPEGFSTYISNETFPTCLVKPDSAQTNVTLIGYGEMAEGLITVADTLFEDHDLVAQVLCPTQIYPFSVRPFLYELEKSDAIIIVEEGQNFSGFGSEVLAQMAEIPSLKNKLCKRIAPAPFPIPASGPQELDMLPNEKIILHVLGETFRDY